MALHCSIPLFFSVMTGYAHNFHFVTVLLTIFFQMWEGPDTRSTP